MDSSATNNWFKLPMFWLFILAMLAFLVCYAFRPIFDPDFWWHLKSGEQMWLNKGLLQQDPFSYTGGGLTSLRETLILQGYWLWQILAYGLYELGQFNGIFVLKFATLFSMLMVTIWQFQRRRVDFLLAAPLLALSFTLLSLIYYMERPQAVSFLFTAILLGLLNEVKEGGRLGWSLPLLMALWGNMHGGFIVGQILLGLFALGAILEYRKHQQHLLRHVFLWVSFALLASLLNPNGVDTLYGALKIYNGLLVDSIGEYASSFTAFMTGSYYVVILWVFIGVYILGLRSSRHRYWPEIVMAIFLIWFSVAHQRNVAFFSFAMLPAVGVCLQRVINQFPYQKIQVFFGTLLILAIAAMGFRGWEFRHEKSFMGDVNQFFPVAAVDFLQRSSIQGNMFNHYNFGGYLLWRLYPERQVFIDSRGMKPEIYKDWITISTAWLPVGSSGRKKYEELLDHYDIDFVIYPVLQLFTGRITPLVKFLLLKPDWQPVYVDKQFYVLVRNSKKNDLFIKRFAQAKHQFIEKIILNLKQQISFQPNDVKHRVGLTEMLIYYGRHNQAQQQIDTIRGIQPQNPELPILIDQLNFSKGSK